MFGDITLGQYYHTRSLLHRLDPRVKLVGTFWYIVSLFVCNDVPSFAVATLFLILMIRLSRVPVGFMFKGLKGLGIIMLITMLFNIFLTPGVPIARFWIFSVTMEGIVSAVMLMIRLVYLVTGTSIMTLTTTPNRLTDGLEKLLLPLKILRVPVHEMAMMMSISLRFIPILMEETERIMKAQMARGADFEHGGLIKKARNMIPLLVPLFVSAFRRASDLALAMEARCYTSGEGRTRLYPLKYKRRDALAYLVLVLYFAAVVLCVILLG